MYVGLPREINFYGSHVREFSVKPYNTGGEISRLWLSYNMPRPRYPLAT